MTRESLLTAGCHVVAAEGYAAASIAKIAETAGVAQGTFYNYFADRQALFDEMLPYIGLRMREAVEQAARDAPPGLRREVRRFEAFLRYVDENDGFYRILYEAEVFSPTAHRVHIENIVSGYRRTIRRAIATGRFPLMSDGKIECIIYQLLGMRAYAAMQIHSETNREQRARIIADAVDVYGRILNASLIVE